MKETIGFDIDGVLYNITRPAYIELKIYHGLDVPFEIFWKDHLKYYPETFWKNFFKIAVLYEKSMPVCGSVDLLNNKYNIVYITSRPEEVKFVTYYWLKSNKFPKYEDLYFSKDKSVEIRLLDCKYFIEDQWAQDKIDRMSLVTNLILVDQIYNRHIKNVIRIKQLDELERLL